MFVIPIVWHSVLDSLSPKWQLVRSALTPDNWVLLWFSHFASLASWTDVAETWQHPSAPAAVNHEHLAVVQTRALAVNLVQICAFAGPCSAWHACVMSLHWCWCCTRCFPCNVSVRQGTSLHVSFIRRPIWCSLRWITSIWFFSKHLMTPFNQWLIRNNNSTCISPSLLLYAYSYRPISYYSCGRNECERHSRPLTPSVGYDGKPLRPLVEVSIKLWGT